MPSASTGPIAIGVDRTDWHLKFELFAKERGIPCSVVEMQRSDWIERVRGAACLLWRLNVDPPYCEEAKEKLAFASQVLRKPIFPSWNSVWHYDNKRAQAYYLKELGVAIPSTFVSFSRDEAREYARHASFPLVSKSAGGAASSGVGLLRDVNAAERELKRIFRSSWTERALRRLGVGVRFGRRWNTSYVLWQQFVPGNARDLRITVIGKRHAFAFWRRNRPGDFRASGSGLIDYSVGDVEREVRLCLDICQRADFDCMAFDVLSLDGGPVVAEVSCAFNDRAIFNAPTHFVLETGGVLAVHPGHVWPQELIIGCIAERYVSGTLGSSVTAACCTPGSVFGAS